MKAVFKLDANLELIPHNQETLDYVAGLKEGDVVVMNVKKEKKRTLQQNSCLHGYIADLSEKLNEGGYDVGTTITIPVSFTPDTVKKYMVHKVMKALYPDKKSTKELDTKQIKEVYENLNAMTAEKFGISCLWPSRF